MKKDRTKKGFPVGICLIIFLILLLLSTAISAGYFYIEGKRKIEEIVEYTRICSLTLAEAVGNVAELSYMNNDFSKLRSLFNEKIEKKVIDEAFFVLADGKIIAHSDKRILKGLKGNIATDEFAYNVDQIFLPIKSKSKSAQFLDYNIINKKVPFNKEIRKLFKKYFYKKFDIVGWLITRAVYVKDKAVGCVSLIISKDKIYNFLFTHINNTINLLIVLGIITVTVPVLISIIVYLRYRNLRVISALTGKQESIKEPVRVMDIEINGITRNLPRWELTIPVTETSYGGDDVNGGEAIKDAIPVADK